MTAFENRFMFWFTIIVIVALCSVGVSLLFTNNGDDDMGGPSGWQWPW